MALEQGSTFLELGFDWYILEKWDPESLETKLEQHIRLGKEYAKLGHRGRKSYVATATHYGAYPEEVPIPRPIDQVPQDLLTPHEREVNRHYNPVWIRTEYCPGTDVRHQELLDGIGECHLGAFGHEEPILDDSLRYNLTDLDTLFAFVPVLLEFAGPYYHQYAVPWEDDQVQDDILNIPEPGDSKEERIEKLIVHQRHFFVADDEAMRSGLVIWVHVDEFGDVVQRNRVGPPLLMQISGFMQNGLRLGEMGVGYGDGEWGGCWRSKAFVGPYPRT